MKKILTLLTLTFAFALNAQINGETLLQNAIKYHDPNGNWQQFNSSFTIEMQMPKTTKRTSVITLNNAAQFFKVKATKDSVTTTYTINKGKCQIQRNAKLLDSASAAKHKLSCNRAKLYKNYYTYLYGLPMKLNDAGTIIHKKVETKTLKGKSYLVLKVSYDKAVGNDIWFFYFSPKTYALKAYQFFKTDENGKLKPKTGEYILLSEEATINGIKIPKVRQWYYNKDDAYLATDTMVMG